MRLAPYWSFLLVFLILHACTTPDPPPPCGPVPAPRQLAWQELEFYAFVHFNMNTFTNMEWGFGDEDPDTFNPTELDTRQWARICRDAGMTGIIITAKHHDGFCLWPSDYTEHSVKNSAWRNGQGDVIRELANACEEFGLKLGIYLSPWDRNHPAYGQPEYLDYFRNQLRELLTEYGEVFEVWFDGANGGTGYYGGANEERRVDKLSYYDWETTYAIIRELQPKAVIFSDAGPDVRWIGNEHGYAYPTTWSTLMRDSVYAGMPEYASQWSAGQDTGTHWVPPEVNVSIRPGWYYHPYEDHKVKRLDQLLDNYYHALGRNAPLLLNLPVDTRGLVHERDAEQLAKLAAKIREDFAQNLATGQAVQSSSSWGRGYGPGQLIDEDPDTYWAAATADEPAVITLTFEEPTRFNRFLIKEYIALGQRVKAFTLEVLDQEGNWNEVASETTIGYQRILRLPELTATALRLTITDAKCPPTLSELQVFWAPPTLVPPTIQRDRAGLVTLAMPQPETEVHYTLDGTEPSLQSTTYRGPFTLTMPATVRARAWHRATGEASETAVQTFDVAKSGWRIPGQEEEAQRAIDDDPSTYWTATGRDLIIDLGETLNLQGFTYLPMQARANTGLIDSYVLYTRTANSGWSAASRGEFGNIKNSPLEQRIRFPTRPARYIRLRARSTVDNDAPAYGEVGVITEGEGES